MASAFNLLTAGGARFDKSRFKKDIDLFQGSKPKESSKSKGKGKERAADASALPNSLNLFHTAQPKSKSKGVKNQDQDQDSEDSGSESDSGESSSSSSSSTSIPAPPKQKITISGPEPLPRSLHANLPSLVTDLPSSSGQPLLNALKGSNIHSLWGVQCAVGGCILEGRDTMCVAPTGSGKTLSYVLPTLVRLGNPARALRERQGEGEGQGVGGEGIGIRSLILVPTHDLAIQIEGVVKAVTRGRGWRVMVLTKATQKAVCDSAPGSGSGDSQSEDQDQEESGASEGEDEEEETMDKTPLGVDVLIATPERLHHLLEEGKLSLADTAHLILDESDRLLSSDFITQTQPIVEGCTNAQVQKVFLSATMPAGSESTARGWMKDGGVRVVVGVKDSAVTSISQSLLYTASEPGKVLALRNLISTGSLPYPSLIFTQSIERADELYELLALEGLRVEVVHGNKAMGKRDEAIKGFREGRVWVLVVTEVLARGMDFRGVKVVVNYDFPQTVQSYIHRIGRTGRAGRPGKAITFFSNEDAPYLRTIANVLQASGCPVPAYMLSLAPPSKNTKKNLAKAPPKRKNVGGGGRDVGKEEGRRKRAMIDASRARGARGARQGDEAGKAEAGSK